jgi:hypothetical protein
MSSFVNTLRRCHSMVRGLRKSCAPISGFERRFGPHALVAGCIGLGAGMLLLALGLALSSLGLLLAGGIVAGLGQGSSFRHGPAINAAAPAQRRAEVASALFIVAYLGISLPVVGVGLLSEVVGLRDASLSFAALLAALAAAVVALLAVETPKRATRTSPGAGRPALSKTT